MWNGSPGQYEIYMNDVLLEKKHFSCCEIYKSLNENDGATGTFVIRIVGPAYDERVFSIVPAICRMSSGGCGTLVKCSSVCAQPFVVTACHCISSTDHAKSTIAYFENASIHLSPKHMFVKSERYCNGGIDVSCIGVTPEDLKKLKAQRIVPHEISNTIISPCNHGLLLHFKAEQPLMFHRTICKYKDKNHYDYIYGVRSGPGSSGAPVFHIENNIGVYGALHIGQNKCTPSKEITDLLIKHLVQS